ncbi:hypothetical protein ACU4GI_21965 [Cupriavidus basilensis]
MSDEFTLLAALLLCSAALVLALRQLIRAVRRGEEELLFWGGAVYFAIFPMLVDALAFMFGDMQRISALISKESPNYWDGVTPEILFQGSLFVFAFNGIFYLGNILARKLIKVNRQKPLPAYGVASQIILLAIIIAACSVVISSGADFIENQRNSVQMDRATGLAQLFIPVGAICAFVFIRQKKYFVASLFIVPVIVVAVLSQARSIFFLIPGAILMAYVTEKERRISIASLLLTAFVFLLLSQAVKLVSNENYGFWVQDNKIEFLLVNMFRDVSIGDYYYSIDVRNRRENLTTEGASSLALVATGVIPPFAARELFDPANTVTYRIYKLRFGEFDFGSMHPTIYGFAYFDLGPFGIMLGLLLPFLMQIYRLLCGKLIFMRPVAPVSIAAFYFVAMRGSLNVAYAKLVFTGFVSFAIFFAIYYCVSRISSRN